MQNNTIAFTILKFPVLVRVQRNFTTVYSIFSFPLTSQTRGWYSYTFNFFSLAFPTSMFQSTIFLKGTSFALLVSCQIQTLASPWSSSIAPKIEVLFKGSVFCLPKESRVYRWVPHSLKVQAKDPVCLSCVVYAIAITFGRGTHVNLVGSGKGAKCSAHQRRSRVYWGDHLGWVRSDLLRITVADISWINCCWVLEVDRGVSVGCQGVLFPCSKGLRETVDPLVCPEVLRKEEINQLSALHR